MPASSPLVTGVGGTALAVQPDGAYGSESVWNDDEGIFAAGGKSESAPLWAGIAALADQDDHGQLGFLNAGRYRIGHSTRYHRAFHDIAQGNSTVTLPSGKNIDGYRARAGWDPVTGWGQSRRTGARAAARQSVRPGDGQGL